MAGAVHQNVLRICFLLIFMGCGSGTNSGAVKYYLQRAATNTLDNHFILEIQGKFTPMYSINGQGFTASVPFDTILDAQESTLITADQFGEVFLDITLFQENRMAYLQDRLSWKSSLEVPPDPNPYFSEDASKDAFVYLVLPASRGRNVQEVWVEGDLETAVAAGQYYDIPTDDQLLVHLSEGDGIKNLRVKYRNIFGTDGNSVDLQILRKGQPPVQCQATPVATTTATGLVRTRIQAINDGDLYFKVEGDVDTVKDYQSFTASIDEVISLSAGEGLKNLTVKIRDKAGNFCDDIALQITYDRSYLPGAVTIQNNALWTDDPDIIILPQFDQLAGDDISMYISGTIAATADTFQWIPYAETVNVNLSPVDGTRHITVQFRKDLTLMSEVAVAIYLKPFVLINGSGAVVSVVPSNIIGARALTITGCTESYVEVAYASSYSCTRSAALATRVFFSSIIGYEALCLSHGGCYGRYCDFSYRCWLRLGFCGSALYRGAADRYSLGEKIDRRFDNLIAHFFGRIAATFGWCRRLYELIASFFKVELLLFKKAGDIQFEFLFFFQPLIAVGHSLLLLFPFFSEVQGPDDGTGLMWKTHIDFIRISHAFS